MGLFSRAKEGIKSRANAAIDKAIDPAKEVDLAIIELEAGRKAAIAELISYKASAKIMEADQLKFEAKAATWEQRAVTAVKAGDDAAAKVALGEKRAALIEAAKIKRDRGEATGYAIQLNKSRKEFETKLNILKMKKGTLATQIAAARSAGGDVFGHDTTVWDKFASAEQRIEGDVIATEVDAALRSEQDAEAALEAGIAKLPEGGGREGGDAGLDAIKAKVAAEREARAQRIAAASGKALPAPTRPSSKPGEAAPARAPDAAVAPDDEGQA